MEKSNPEHTREELQGLTSCTHTVFALLEGSIEKIVLRWNEDFLCSYMGPNQERIIVQMASRHSVWPQVSFIKLYKGIGKPLIGLCVYGSVLIRWFASGDTFVYLQ